MTSKRRHSASKWLDSALNSRRERLKPSHCWHYFETWLNYETLGLNNWGCLVTWQVPSLAKWRFLLRGRGDSSPLSGKKSKRKAYTLIRSLGNGFLPLNFMADENPVCNWFIKVESKTTSDYAWRHTLIWADRKSLDDDFVGVWHPYKTNL